jgi:hypothetical protein
MERTRVYQAWVAAYARHHALPLEWTQKVERKEDLVRHPDLSKKLQIFERTVPLTLN